MNKRGRKPNPNNNYFNEEVEFALCQYKNSDSYSERERAFRIVYPAFCKIAEVMINKMRISYYDTTKKDLQADAVSFMVEKMHMFDCNAGKKAFSYFTVVCKHYLIYVNNKNHKYLKTNSAMSEMGDEFDVNDFSIHRDEQINEAKALLNGFTEYLQINFNSVFPTKISKSVGTTLIDKLENWENFIDLGQQKIFNLMWDESSVNTRANFTKLINNVVSHYTLFKKRWETGDTSMDFISKKSLTNEEKDEVKSNYIQYDKKFGVIAYAKKFGLPEHIVRDYLKNIDYVK
jgi:hypothetical protein